MTPALPFPAFPLLIAAGLLPSAVRAAPTREPMVGFLMGYSTESSGGGENSWALHLATSGDGLDWMPLNQNEPVLVPTLGQKSLRDPFFLRKQDGGFVVLATDPSGGDGGALPDIHVWDTDDFISFNNGRLLKLHDAAMHAVAPEAFYDFGKKQYAIIWSGDSDYHRIYINYTGDFTRVSPHEVFFDPGHDAQDATLCPEPVDGEHFLYYKDSGTRLSGARSGPLDPRSFDRNTYARPPGRATVSAPLFVRSLDENLWFLYGESYRRENNGFYAWQTDDITKAAWRELSMRDFNPPLNSKHATVVPVARAEIDRLTGHWGRPKWNRLKSYNFPGCFVRHDELQVRISAYPFDPHQNSQWRIVPGLADAAGVSFESIDLPGHYLRSVAEHVVIAKDDESPAFRSKATFVKVPGLADSSWSSFHALSSPDLFLRHAYNSLRLEAVNTRTDKEDATFRIVF